MWVCLGVHGVGIGGGAIVRLKKNPGEDFSPLVQGVCTSSRDQARYPSYGSSVGMGRLHLKKIAVGLKFELYSCLYSVSHFFFYIAVFYCERNWKI